MNKFLREKDVRICCGCGACAAVCPSGCIVMRTDSEGFLYPALTLPCCNDCGLCSEVCPIENDSKGLLKAAEPKGAYAAYVNDSVVLKNSSSGGIFYSLAKKVIEEGGCVFGVTIDREHQTYHIRVDTVEDIQRIMGSKYIESNTKDTFLQVKKLLSKGKTVLYAGTPCQVSGLRYYLDNINCDHLFIVDLLCHGIPSQKMFDKYVLYLEDRYRGKLETIYFRDKERRGWSITQRHTIRKRNGKVRKYYLERHFSPYFSGFIRGILQRESCYTCPYTSISRVGDLTLADFWGVDRVRPELLNPAGTSLIFANTERGEKLLDKIKENINITEVTVEDGIKYNPNFYEPPARPSIRDDIYKIVFDKGMKKAERVLLPSDYKKIFIMGLLPKDFKKTVKKIFGKDRTIHL